MAELTFRADGTAVAIWDDELVGTLEALGEAKVERASNVEPSPAGWVAAIKDGPELGPYRTRGEAITAEVAWLKVSGRVS